VILPDDGGARWWGNTSQQCSADQAQQAAKPHPLTAIARRYGPHPVGGGMDVASSQASANIATEAAVTTRCCCFTWRVASSAVGHECHVCASASSSSAG
jgi:hypothetical protein